VARARTSPEGLVTLVSPSHELRSLLGLSPIARERDVALSPLLLGPSQEQLRQQLLELTSEDDTWQAHVRLVDDLSLTRTLHLTAIRDPASDLGDGDRHWTLVLRDLSSQQQLLNSYQHAQAQMQTMLDLLDATVFLFDREQRVVAFNRKAQQRAVSNFGIAPKLGYQLPVRSSLDDELARTLAGEEIKRIRTPPELHNVAPRARPYWTEYQFKPVRDDAGAIIGAAYYGRDITDQVQAQRDLERSNAFQSALIAIANAVVRAPSYADPLRFLLDQVVARVPGAQTGSVLMHQGDGSYRFVAAVGYPLDTLKRVRIPEAALDPIDSERVVFRARILEDRLDVESRAALAHASGENTTGSTLSIPLRGRSDRHGFMQLNATDPNAFTPGDVELGTLLGDLLSGLIERLALERELEEQRSAAAHAARHDTLTGLPNRLLLSDRIEHALALDNRNGLVSSLMIVNLDGFKVFNDLHGPSSADAVLASFAARLREALGDADTIARLSADEFAVLHAGLQDVKAVEALAQHALSVANRPTSETPVPWDGGASIGIAVAPDDGSTAEALLAHASLALTRAKRAGRGTLAFYTRTLEERTRAYTQLERDLRHALTSGDGLTAHLQPIVRLTDGACVGFEALARWTHPVRGPISPADFIPLCEDLGVTHTLTGLVFDSAARAFAALKPLDTAQRWRLSLNISALDLMSGDVLTLVHTTLERSGLQARDLTLELTESAALEDAPEITATLANVRALGVRVAIDDFGTGYASMRRLASLAADALKLDQSFVRAAPSVRGDEAVVEATVALADAFGLDVVAEGVETLVQAHAMRSKGCGFAQGYLFGRPMPADAIAAWLHDHTARAWPLGDAATP